MMEKIKLLLVDDEEQFCKTTSKILSKRGYEVTTAGTGYEAIDILKHKAQDVVILDVRMPGMDGHKTLNEIRKICPQTRVIMLTGNGGPDSAYSSSELGAYDYLTKPCNIDLMSSKIRRAYSATRTQGDVKKERLAGDVMIRIDDCISVTEDKTVKEAIEQIMRSFEGSGSGHFPILVFDKNNRELTGILSIHDLIRALRPAYLSAPKPSIADSARYSDLFWAGLFTAQTQSLANKKVGEVISSEAPPTADESTSLMELANLMQTQGSSRVVITGMGKIIGVVREQELFFEMAVLIS